ncbi:oncoprotein-induced transcript 3 protein-like [Strongylocentrotus purpuratus]|uniref:Zona pellucida sperm-binding protein 3 n=1 Tax=Strongylocentrotus purpuratus TaxID=7668 RepID=A0A7M7NPK8_STRPU|nr:oncoprotein-induced transcript 3 protein-like [Strongylocentrotus purpuratus]
MCQDKLTSVECGSTSMTVNVDARLVRGDASGVHFHNRSCNGVINATTDIITLTTDYNECGTILEEDNTTVTFSNVITYAKPGSEDGTVITRKYHMQVRVECCLKKEEVISGSFRPQLGEVSFSDKGSGDFSMRLERFQTNAFDRSESETTSVVGKGDDLYFGVYLESVPGVGMFIDSCWATTTQDSDKEPHYSLISSGCYSVTGLLLGNDTLKALRKIGIDADEASCLTSFCRVFKSGSTIFLKK